MTGVAMSSGVSRSGGQQDDCLISTGIPVKLLFSIEEKKGETLMAVGPLRQIYPTNQSDHQMCSDKCLSKMPS